MHGEQKGLYGDQDVISCGGLLSICITYNCPFVDQVSDLCVTRSRDSGGAVAVLSPNKKFLSSVFILWVS